MVWGVLTFMNSAFQFIFGLEGNKARGYGHNPKWTQWLKQECQNYDAVIIHGIWQYHAYGTYKALSEDDTPYYIFPHGMLDPKCGFQRNTHLSI